MCPRRRHEGYHVLQTAQEASCGADKIFVGGVLASSRSLNPERAFRPLTNSCRYLWCNRWQSTNSGARMHVLRMTLSNVRFPAPGRRLAALLVAGLLALAAAPGHTRAQAADSAGTSAEDCLLGASANMDWTARIAACTEGINLERWAPAQRAAAYNNRCLAYIEIGRYQDAVNDCTVAIDLDADEPTAYFNRGIAHIRLDQFEHAVADFDRTIAISPTMAGAYLNRGIANANLGAREDAIRDYDAAIRLDPRNPMALINRGRMFYDMRRYQEAIDDYDRAIDIAPRVGEAYNNRANAWCKLGFVEVAMTDRLRAAEFGAFSLGQLQGALREFGYYRGAIDGRLTEDLRASLREWTEGGCLGI